MTAIDQAICNLEYTRDELFRLCNNDKNYNTEWGIALNLMGLSLDRHAQELKERQYIFGGIENV